MPYAQEESNIEAAKSKPKHQQDLKIAYYVRVEELRETPKIDFSKFLDSVGDVYSFLGKNLSDYYGKEADNLLVQQFLAWIKDNGKQAMEGIRNRIASGEVEVPVHNEAYASYLLGFLLGGEYVAAMNPPVHNAKAPMFPKIRGEYHASDKYENGILQLEVFPTDKTAMGEDMEYAMNNLIAGVNSGIHEHTHALPQIYGLDNKCILSELAVFFTQSDLGLPIKIDEEEMLFASSVRDWTHIISEMDSGRLKMDLDRIFMMEYISFLCGPWVKSYYGGGADIYQFMVDPLDEPKIRDIYKKKIGFEEYCNKTGITDENLRNKFKKLFENMQKKSWKNEWEFLKIFREEMSKKERFGPPASKPIPEGFVLFEEFDWLRPSKSGYAKA